MAACYFENIADGRLALMKKRDRLYARNLKKPGGLGQADIVKLRELTALVSRRCRDMKRAYFAERLNDAGSNSKKAWEVLHSFIDKQGKGGAPCRTFEKEGTLITRAITLGPKFCNL